MAEIPAGEEPNKDILKLRSKKGRSQKQGEEGSWLLPWSLIPDLRQLANHDFNELKSEIGRSKIPLITLLLKS